MSMLSRQIFARGAAVVGIVLVAALSVSAAEIPTVWAHRPYVVQRAVTNHTGTARTVAKVTTSCACLAARRRDGEGAVATQGVIPFELTLNPAGMEGPVVKAATVTFDDGSSETMTVRANVRLRLGMKPQDAAFGAVKRQDAGRTITASLAGAALKDGARIVTVEPPPHAAFAVRPAEDGRSVTAAFAEGRPRSGCFSEIWTFRTNDVEVPEIKFPVSAFVTDELAVSPRVITVGWNDPVCSRVVTVRGKKPFKVLSAETKPRRWGEVTIVSRPLNGWQIRIDGINPDEVRQFSKKPFLEVKTDMPGLERFEIPLRVTNDGGAK